MRKFALLTALVLLAAACGQADSGVTPTEPATTAVPGTTSPDTPVDSGSTSTTLPAPGGQKGPALVDSVDLLLLESYPVQVMATVHGSLPTPCHSLAWNLGEPEPRGPIVLEVYSRYDPTQVCAQVLQSFEENIPVGSFTTGAYLLVVNGIEYPFSI